uniref:Uncharacterized protein LOC114344955 n=1 Tax=Diabrotica virgifera virgifera TaxID=50390 RepID=A0A6P7GNU6_DIAVI
MNTQYQQQKKKKAWKNNGKTSKILAQKLQIKNDVIFRYHLKTFDKTVTVHYVRSSQMFHTNIVRAPALVFVSKSDPIGSETSNRRVTDNWENMGMQVTFKTWENTPHVGHYQAHPKEYLSELNSFLGSLNIKQPSKIEEKVKASAKL